MRSKMRLLSYKGAVASYEYNHYEGDLPIMLGTDRRGEVIMGDLARMGNLLLWGVGVEPMKMILVFMNDPAFLLGITKTEKLFDEFLCYYASFPVRAVGVHLILASQPTDILRWKLFMPGLMRNRLEFLGADRVPLGEGYDLQAREWLEEYDNMIYHGYDTDEKGMFLQRIVN